MKKPAWIVLVGLAGVIGAWAFLRTPAPPSVPPPGGALVALRLGGLH